MPKPIDPTATCGPILDVTLAGMQPRHGVELDPRVLAYIHDRALVALRTTGAAREAARASLAELVRLAGVALAAVRASLRAEAEAGRAPAGGAK
ncbi:MAG: hypothetical protein U1E39_09475 [Planctomycetota bacterium]